MAISDDLRGIYKFLTDGECNRLYELAAGCPNGVIVEIGSFQGGSTVALAKGAQAAGGHVWAVDPHTDYQVTSDTHYGEENYQALLANLAAYGVADSVTVLKMASIEAFARWTRPIDLLWIDGSHEYADVRQDFITWSKHVTGRIALHDTSGNHPGVSRLLAEVLNGDIIQLDAWHLVERIDSMAVLERVVTYA